jgi:2-hydroxychromene-2-carboxylate isomerase
MMSSAEWYFDFISPFAYLQLEAFHRLPPDVSVTLRPVLFAALLQHWGHKGPAEIPQKRRFTYRFVQWRAERDGIPLKFPKAHPFNPIKALRLAIAAGNRLEPVRAIFRHIWREGKSLDDAQEWGELCAKVGIADADARISQADIKDELKRNGAMALQAGLFGVPSFVIGGEIFWGDDATDMVIDFLREPERFNSGEFARIVDLPGIARAAKTP